MRRSVLIVSIALLLFPRTPAGAEDVLLGLFEEYLESLRRQAGIPGLSAAIVGDEDILWERGFGLQDIERSIPASPDTPYHLDGLTQVFTAALALRCVEEGRLSLDERIGQFDPDSPEAGSTVRQVLTHTSSGPNGLVFNYDPERLASLTVVVPVCIDDSSFRETVAITLNRFAMRDSAPGPDAANLAPDPSTPFDRRTIERYASVLGRLATPYAVDRKGRATRSQHPATELSAAGGLISTVRDVARFDIALRKALLREETLEAAWRSPAGAGKPLPHGIGWFVQTHNRQQIVWQFGVAENASSSLIIKLPDRRLTLILLANSDGLAARIPLAAGDVIASPMAHLFLRWFAR
jgi:CubicO group peptidase (beta-lactamase class C family)